MVYSISGFELISINLSKSVAFSLQTSELKFTNAQPLQGAIFRGHPVNVSFMQFLKILMVSDKMIHKAFRILKIL